MGVHSSCCDESRIPTSQDLNALKIFTESEITEFIANNSYLTPDEKFIQESSEKPLSKLEKQRFLSLFYDTSPGGQRLSVGSPQMQRPVSVSPSKGLSRIFSSNADKNSMNLIEHLHKCNSLCSTNNNSKCNSRCVSPISKPKPTLID